jgi:hypothetical protein
MLIKVPQSQENSQSNILVQDSQQANEEDIISGNILLNPEITNFGKNY